MRTYGRAVKATATAKLRPWGVGIFTPRPAPVVDCGAVSPHALAPKPSDFVSIADQAEWSAMAREITKNRRVMLAQREAESRDAVMDAIVVNDLEFADRELMEAQRFDSYGW